MSAKSPKRQHGRSAVNKLDACKPQDATMQAELESSLSEALADSSTDEWPIFKKTVFATTAGYRKSHQKDWFDDQDGSASHLLDEMHNTHLSWINDKSNASKRAAYTSARRATQRSLRQMKERWWLNKAVELQQAADKRDMKA